MPSDPAHAPGDEAAAWELFEQLRWGGAPSACPHCGVEGRTYFLQPAGGVRHTRTGAQTVRRVWKCGACRRQFSVLTGTVLEGTRISLTTWISAVARRSEGLALPVSLAPAPVRRHLEQVLSAVADVIDRRTDEIGADRTP